MKVTNYQSSTVLIEDDKTKVLCDPWLVDGEHYGSWNHYPPLDIDFKIFDDVDFIYLSHVHDDHVSLKTLPLLNRNISILMHKFESKFLRISVVDLGFEVIEVDPLEKLHLSNTMDIQILPAAPCNPEACGLFLGCGVMEKKYRMSIIDTMAVFSSGREVIVNTNDCPYELAEDACRLVKQKYLDIDLLLTGYLGAGPYPQCFEIPNLYEEAIHKKFTFLQKAANFMKLLRPKYTMPFAGQYVLAGKLTKLEPFKGQPDFHETVDYLTTHGKGKLVYINTGETFDITNGTQTKPYTPINPHELEEYKLNVLSQRLLDYEWEGFPEWESIYMTLDRAYETMEYKRNQIDFKSYTTMYIKTPQFPHYIKISMMGAGWTIDDKKPERDYVIYNIDSRLLLWILKGPRYKGGLWSRAEGGSHIYYERSPNIFERGLHFCMNFFHE